MIDTECIEDLVCMSEILKNLAKELKDESKEYDVKGNLLLSKIKFMIKYIMADIEYIENTVKHTERNTHENVYKKIQKMMDLYYHCRSVGAYIFKMKITKKMDDDLFDLLTKIESEVECIEARIVEMFVDYNKAANGRSE